ncbi:MAG: hypothetical protein PHQ43_07525 [Dehalococcoidales bacterium]|nr:hypothetical protein [Dehalococcoidales bacterium]
MDDIDLGAALDPQGPVVDAEFVEAEMVLMPGKIMTVTSRFDLAPVALSLEPYQRHVALMTQEARSITVTDPASQKLAVSAESRNKKLYKDLETARKSFVAPYNDHVKKINNLFKTLTDPLVQNMDAIRGTRGKYELQLEMERRRKEAAAREEQGRLQAKLDAEAREQRLEAERKVREAAKKLQDEKDEATRIALKKEIAEETAAAAAPTPQAPLMTEKQGVVRTAEGSSYTKFKWVCRIVDPALVPREYCEPAPKLLDAAAKGGVRNIPGCVIEEVPVPVTRV